MQVDLSGRNAMKDKQGIRSSLFNNPTFRILLFFIIVLLSFAFIFARLEKITFFDAVYWVITTCSTVGYGDISPSNTLTKIITMILMISGVALLGYLLSTISNTLISLNMGKMMGLSRIKTSNHVIVSGWNLIGRIATEELVKIGLEVVVIDEEQQAAISGIANVHFVLGSCNDENTLQKASITTAAGIILAMESDADVILGVSSIRKSNSDITIIGRIDDLYFADVAKQAGCNRVVSPSEIGGHMLASSLFEPSVVRWFSEATVACEGIDLTDIPGTDEHVAGKTIATIGSGDNRSIIGIDRGSRQHIEALPDADTSIAAGDTLVAISKHSEKAPVATGGECRASRKIREGDVLFIGWNPTIRSAVSELLYAKKYTVSVLCSEAPVSEKEYYEQEGVTFISKDISKLSLQKALQDHGENVVVGIEDDSDSILASHIIRNLNNEVNLIVRIDDPANKEAAWSICSNQIVSPSGIGGRLLAHAMDRPSSVSLLMEATTSTTGIDIEEYSVDDGDRIVGKTVADFTREGKYKVVGIDTTDHFISMPPESTPVQAGDTIVYLSA